MPGMMKAMADWRALLRGAGRRGWAHQRASRRLAGLLEGPMIVLGLVWLALFLIDLIWAVSPWLGLAVTLIWVVFIADFALRLWLARDRMTYLRSNWLSALALVVPALRALRVL